MNEINSISFYPAIDRWGHTIPFAPSEVKQYQEWMIRGSSPLVSFSGRLVCVRDLEALQVWLVQNSWRLVHKQEADRILYKLEGIDDPPERTYLIKRRMYLLEVAQAAEEKMRQLECPEVV